MSSTDILVQAKKKQKCFMINPDNNTTENVQTFSVSEQQSFSISCLELWKRIGEHEKGYDLSKIIDTNHAKLLQYQDRFSQGNKKLPGGDDKATGTGPLTTEAKKAAIQQALELAHKATSELNMLAQLTSLVNSNQILSLQTFHNLELNDHLATAGESISFSSLQHARNSQNMRDSFNLPIAKRIEIQRQSMKRARTKLLLNFNRCSSKVKQRQCFAETIRQWQDHQQQGIQLCCVEKASGKPVLRRKYDPKRDYIAVNCSVTVSSESAALTTAAAVAGYNHDKQQRSQFPLPISAVGKKTTVPASSAASVGSIASSVNTLTKHAFVPILMGKSGLELEAADSEKVDHTLQLQLLMVHPSSRVNLSECHVSSNASSDQHSRAVTVVCSVSAWNLLEEKHAAAQQLSESLDDAVQNVSSHCRRRKHETLSRVAFECLQRECVGNTAHWDAITATALHSHDQQRAYKSYENSSTGVITKEQGEKLRSALLKEKLASSLVTVRSEESEIILRVADSLLFCISLVPINKKLNVEDHNSMEVDVSVTGVSDVGAVAGGFDELARKRLQQCSEKALLQSLSLLLCGSQEIISAKDTGVGSLSQTACDSSITCNYWAQVRIKSLSSTGRGAGIDSPEGLLQRMDADIKKCIHALRKISKINK